MQRLMLIRHGESEWNRDGIIQGFKDCDLSELGREQSDRLRLRLDLERIDVAYTSTATRAVDTARIALGHRLQVEERPNLREINLGEWEGVEAAELKRRLPAETELWFRRPSKVRIKGAETLRGFRRRITREINGIRSIHENASVLIVAHGGVICTYMTSLLGLSLDDLWRFKIRNCSITKVMFPMNEPRIEVLNDVSHLDGAVRYAPNTPPQYLL
ncbi:MAG: histidine phosphatase family protein [Candidatus Krumholzibacteria bacterium]|nr:histidine phosphatase family protein [Candidatus Krumholzibacteria bacterium]